MQIKVKCADCGRHIGTFVNVGKKDVEIEIHACYHKDIYDHIKELKAENKQLKEEIEKLKPKPLFFDTISGFKVIISDNVPEGEIWFATDKQLRMALEFSAKQHHQALKGD